MVFSIVNKGSRKRDILGTRLRTVSIKIERKKILPNGSVNFNRSSLVMLVVLNNIIQIESHGLQRVCWNDPSSRDKHL